MAEEGRILRHKNCGEPVGIAVLNHDVAIYVFCDACNDLVEYGELEGVTDINAEKFYIAQGRIRGKT
jgi:hypothetical protein